MSAYGRPALLHRVVASLRLLWRVVVARDAEFRIPENAVVLALDAVEPYRELWDCEKHQHLKRLLNVARANRNRVVFTQWARTRASPADAMTARGPHWSYCLPSDTLVDGCAPLLPGLKEEGDECVAVVATNALATPELSLPPRAPLVLAGMWTESCVINTARAATEDGREVYVYAPACAGHAGISRYVLWTIQSFYAEVCFALRL